MAVVAIRTEKPPLTETITEQPLRPLIDPAECLGSVLMGLRSFLEAKQILNAILNGNEKYEHNMHCLEVILEICGWTPEKFGTTWNDLRESRILSVWTVMQQKVAESPDTTSPGFRGFDARERARELNKLLPGVGEKTLARLYDLGYTPEILAEIMIVP